MSDAVALPLVIQGGMGVGVSNWKLARAVALTGQLGVVSGTVIDTVFVRRLQDGDPGGFLRRALEKFPLPDVAAEILKKYFRPNGRAAGEPYVALPMYKQVVSRFREQVTMAAAFVEVTLAKEGHDGRIGVNLLTKVQMPNLPTLYGAMLAGVDFVLMGAGIPREIPGALDAFAVHQPAALKFDVEGQSADEKVALRFDPRAHGTFAEPLKRPMFLAIISANSLAVTLARKANGKVDGFVVEGPTAGGHNAPPRGELKLNERGEPEYGERDVVDLARLGELGLPFWLAGGHGSPEALGAALDAGAAGIQVGTMFAYCNESGYTASLKQRVLQNVIDGKASVFTDPRASPTGYPFKVVHAEGIATQDDRRQRCCDLGYLRTAYRRADGRLDYRCAAEPVDTWLKKGGAPEATAGRRCLCNALLADIGLGQSRANGEVEPPLLTSGDELVGMGSFLAGRTSYSAEDVVQYLLAGVADAA